PLLAEEEKPDAPTPKPAERISPNKIFRLNQRVYDTTGTIAPRDWERIQILCEDCFEQTGCPLVVVVLNHLSETGDDSGDIRGACEKLLAQFKTGLANPEKTVLLLIGRNPQQKWLVYFWMGKEL